MMVRAIAWREPAAAFASLAGSARLAWLDSGGPLSERSRLSILALDPFRIVQCQHDRVTIDGAPCGLGPFEALQRELARWAMPAGGLPVPFGGGAIGFLGYELAPTLERVPRHQAGRLGVPDMVWGFYDLVLAFDHLEHRVWLLSSGLPETTPHARHRRAERRAAWLLARLSAPPRPAVGIGRLAWRRETPRARYQAAVARLRDYIAAGDLYQANLTTRFLAARPAGLDPADLYLTLRADNPAPFAAYLDCGAALALASVSPERFLRLGADRQIEARPIKGTRPRGGDAETDVALAAELRASAKDQAENLMIVDLLRNDIGRVAEPGSVTVPCLAELESFAAVHHLVSVVQARLRAGLGAVDLLRATFPGGSVTGAPKIRAMQIIAELEDAARGPYCGAIGWIGWDGAMDSSIVIRTVVVTADTIAAQAGGGIVWDSVPAEEYQEMMVKVGPLLRAFGAVPP